jgi:hypothetical protein
MLEWNLTWTYIDIRIAVPSPCMIRCMSHTQAYWSGPPFSISSTVGVVSSHTKCTDRTVPDSRFRNSKTRTVRCSSLPPLSPGLDGWFGRAGGMRLSHLVGECATLSLWLVEGNTATWETVRDFRPGQWEGFRFALELRDLPSPAVVLVSWAANWGVRYTRHIAGVVRCRAVGLGCGCRTVSHTDDSRMSWETSGCCAVLRVCSHTGVIWSCRSVGAIGAAVVLVYLCTSGSHMPEETLCDFVVQLCLYTAGLYRVGHKLERHAGGARAGLRTSEETSKCYIVAVVVAAVVAAVVADAAAAAAAGFEPKAHNWLGAARAADSWHSLGLFPDSEIALSHSVHMTMVAVALSGVLLLHDAAGA